MPKSRQLDLQVWSSADIWPEDINLRITSLSAMFKQRGLMGVPREKNPGSNLEVIQYSEVTQNKDWKGLASKTGGKKFKKDELDDWFAFYVQINLRSPYGVYPFIQGKCKNSKVCII